MRRPTRRAVCWMSCSTVWNRLRPVVRAASDENDVQQGFGHDGRPACRADRAVRQSFADRGSRTGGGGGHRLPVPRRRCWAGWVLGVSGQRRRCGQRGSCGSLGCRRVLRPGPVRAWPDVIEVGCFPARRRRFRCRLLRHRPARGRGDGSSAASAAGSGLGSAGARRYRARWPERNPRRGDDGRVLQRVSNGLGRKPGQH